MSASLATMLLVVVGAQLALQAPINSGLGRYIGLLTATAFSFAVGTLLLLSASVIIGKIGGLADLDGVPVYMLAGGLLGAVFVLTATTTVGKIGAGGVAAATITGQLVGSLALDSAGVIGLEATELSPTRLIGAVALIVGTLLIVRHRGAALRDTDDSGRGHLVTLASLVAMTMAACLVAIQAPVNAQLGDRVSGINASFVSFGIGALLLWAAVLATGNAGRVKNLGRARWWQFTGGSMGAINTTAALLTVQIVGAGLLTAATLAGQLASSVLIDRLGWLGMRKTPLSASRVIGIVLLALGVLLTAR